MCYIAQWHAKTTSSCCSRATCILSADLLGRATAPSDLSRLSPQFDHIFFGKHLIHFLADKMQDFRNFVLHKSILDFDSEQIYLKPQVTNVKNKEVKAKPKPQTLEKIGLSKPPKS